MQRVFGGQVLGQALLAATRTVPPERAVHSLHAYFLVGGDPGVPIVYEVENLRDGRSFSARRVAARQHGRHIFYLTASFQIPEVGPEHQDLAPDVPVPHDCPTLAQSMANTRDDHLGCGAGRRVRRARRPLRRIVRARRGVAGPGASGVGPDVDARG